MQHTDKPLTCLEMLNKAAALGITDTDICNRAKTKKMQLHRTTLWRIRSGKLKGSSYLSTLLKLVELIHE